MGNPLSEVFFPERIECIGCDKELEEETKYWLCKDCLPEFNIKFCLRCGRAVKNEAKYCLSCMNNVVYFTQARAPVVFDEHAKTLVYKLKYGESRYVATVLAAFMLDAFYSSDWEVDIVTYVPLHKKRERKRGYNQSRLIAERIAAAIGKPTRALLVKTKYAKNLAKLNLKQRIEAIGGTFSLCDGVELSGKRILMIDDVFTTGTTANECAKVLKGGKCSDIYVLTFATSKIIPQTY